MKNEDLITVGWRQISKLLDIINIKEKRELIIENIISATNIQNLIELVEMLPAIESEPLKDTLYKSQISRKFVKYISSKFNPELISRTYMKILKQNLVALLSEFKDEIDPVSYKDGMNFLNTIV